MPTFASLIDCSSWSTPRRPSFSLLDSLSSLSLQGRVTLMCSRGIFFLGNCFKGHSGFQVNSAQGKRSPIVLWWFWEHTSLLREEAKLPQRHTTEPRHSISLGFRHVVVCSVPRWVPWSALKHPVNILPQHSLCAGLFTKWALDKATLS